MIVRNFSFWYCKKGQISMHSEKNRFNNTSSYSTIQNSYICQTELSPSFHSQSGQLLFVLLQNKPPLPDGTLHCRLFLQAFLSGRFSFFFFLIITVFLVLLLLLPHSYSCHRLPLLNYMLHLDSYFNNSFLFLLQILGILFNEL